MSVLLTSTFHHNIAKTIFNDIQYGNSKYFHFLGKVSPWVPSDQVPSNIVDTQDSLRAVRDEMVIAKRVEPTEVSLVIDRIDWTTGTVYSMWDTTIDMQSLNFYVMTSDYHVYKCLDNNLGAPSTVMPTTILTTPQTLADGYIWKFMYTVADVKKLRFLSPSHIPIQQSISDRFYNGGSITRVVVTSPGSGYDNTSNISLFINGTTGSGATASLSVDGSGAVTLVNILTGGTGYTNGSRIRVTSGVGVGFSGTVNATAGVVTSVTILTHGIGYAITDDVSIYVGGAVILPHVSRVDGSFIGATIVDGGAGYLNTGTSVSITGATYAGAGLFGPAATFISHVVNGVVVHIAVNDPGIDYPPDLSTTITVNGDGTGALFSPIVYNGALVDIFVENAGSNYTYALLSVVGTGTGATLTSILDESDFISDQAVIEQTAVDGAIHAIKVINPGSSYTSATCTITGDGTGCTATVTIALDSTIQKINIVTPGSGYTYANAVITGNNHVNNPNAVDATTLVIFPPNGGHGKNAPEELYAKTVGLYSNLRGSLDESIQQDFRQYGLVYGIRDYYTNAEMMNSTTVKAYVNTTFANVTNLVVDEILVGNNTEFRVLSITGNTVKLIPLGMPTISPVGLLTAKTDTLRTHTCLTITSYPDYNKYSGQVIYFSDDPAFSYSVEQSIILKTYIRF